MLAHHYTGQDTARTTPIRPRRSIVPHLLLLIQDLSVNTGTCYAGDIALARMLSERIGKEVTDRRIRQAIAELQAQDSITIARGPRGRQIRPAEAVVDPLPQPWKFPQKEKEEEKERKERKKRHTQDKTDGLCVGRFDFGDRPELQHRSYDPEYLDWELREYHRALREARQSQPEPSASPDVPTVEPKPVEPVAKLLEPVEHVTKLQALGIGDKKAEALIKEYGADRIAVVIGIVEYAIAEGRKKGKPILSPSGLLISALRDGRQPSPEQREHEARQAALKSAAKAHEDQARQQARERAREQAIDVYLAGLQGAALEALERRAEALAAESLSVFPPLLRDRWRPGHLATARREVARQDLGFPAQG